MGNSDYFYFLHFLVSQKKVFRSAPPLIRNPGSAPEKRIVDDRQVKIITFIIKFGCQGSIDVMLEVKVKVGSRFL